MTESCGKPHRRVKLFMNSPMPGKWSRIFPIQDTLLYYPNDFLLTVSQINSLASLPQLPVSFFCSETMSGSSRPVTSNISCYLVLSASLSLASSWHPTSLLPLGDALCRETPFSASCLLQPLVTAHLLSPHPCGLQEFWAIGQRSFLQTFTSILCFFL